MVVKYYKTTVAEVWDYYIKNWSIMTTDPKNTPMRMIEKIHEGVLTFKGKPVKFK
jgi:hypothetical protein